MTCRRLAAATCFVAAVACEPLEPAAPSGASSADLTVCSTGPTVRGIDVSRWQGSIDWAAVADDDVEFAFVRVSDGINTLDSRFQQNWDGAGNAGLIRGTYQYFRPRQDPIAQAEILLEKIGRTVATGELPPVLDIETTDGRSAGAVVSAASQWLAHVEAELGVTPIIYTYASFWNDKIGSDAFADYPLWVAHFGPSCPNLPDPWMDWKVFQYSATGRVDGIAGDVDTNYFNGSLDDLLEFSDHTPQESECDSRISRSGGIIDDDDECFFAGGDPSFIRTEQDGYGGSLKWTHTTDLDQASNFGRWRFGVEETGSYLVEVYTDSDYAQSRAARYEIAHAGGTAEVTVDQTGRDGWSPVGEFNFDSHDSSWVRLDDNTGEPNESGTRLVFDALRLTRIDPVPGPGQGGEASDEDDDGGQGCNAPGGRSGRRLAVIVLLLVALRGRRRVLE